MEASEKEQAIKQFEDNAEKLEEFIKKNMPGAEYQIFICNMKLGISNITFYQEGTYEDGILTAVSTAFSKFITNNAGSDEWLQGVLAYYTLLHTLFALAEKDPVMKAILTIEMDAAIRGKMQPQTT